MKLKCPECGWIGNDEDLVLFSHVDDPPGVCPGCWCDGQDMEEASPPTYTEWTEQQPGAGGR